MWRQVGPHTSRRLLKHKRKDEAAELRQLVKFAEQFDPLRKTQLSFLETVKRMGWPHRRNETITEGVTVLATMADKYLAFEVRTGLQWGWVRCVTVCVRVRACSHVACGSRLCKRWVFLTSVRVHCSRVC